MNASHRRSGRSAKGDCHRPEGENFHGASWSGSASGSANLGCMPGLARHSCLGVCGARTRGPRSRCLRCCVRFSLFARAGTDAALKGSPEPKTSTVPGGSELHLVTLGTTVPSGLKATVGTMLSLLPATLTSEPAARSSSAAMSGALSSASSSGGKSGHSLR